MTSAKQRIFYLTINVSVPKLNIELYVKPGSTIIPLVTQECRHIDFQGFCCSHASSYVYKVSSFKSGMRQKPVRKNKTKTYFVNLIKYVAV